MESLVIYTITVMEKVEEIFYEKVDEDGNTFKASTKFNEYGDTRVWGFYADKSKAIDALHENALDMHETCYDYACLEAYEEGISHPVLDETQWFKFNKEIGGYVEIEIPMHEEHVCCRAMG